MSFEPDLVTALKLECPRVFPDFAPVTSVKPFVVYHELGGATQIYLNLTLASKRRTLVQIDVYGTVRSEIVTLARAIETRLIGSEVFTAIPQGEPRWDADEDLGLRWTSQDFEIISTR